jgi:GntR family transcriptional repressor for pyruvate dehydrogenase complex
VNSTPSFDPIRSEPAYRRVASAISERIVARTLKDGDTLPTETALAAQLGVNRSTLREALRELESNGLLERRKGSKRLVVSHPAPAAVARGVSRALALQDVTVHEICEALELLEPQLAAAAALRRTAPQLAALEAVTARLAANAAAPDASTQDAVEMVGEFFRALAAASNNPVYAMMQEPLLQLLQSSLNVMIDQAPNARSRISVAQRRLLEAVTANQSEQASDWMGKHVRDFRRGFELAGIDLSFRIR